MITGQFIYVVLFILNIMLIGRAISYKESRFGLIAALDIFGSLAEYVLISGVLFWADCFSIMTSVIIMTVINCAFTVFLTLCKKFTPQKVEFDITLPMAAVLIVGAVLTATKFGYFGMGQDQGVYQVKAIDLMYGTTEKVKDFEEYHDLSDEDKNSYYSAVKKMAGYDIYDILKPTLSREDQPSEVSGIYHGIPTYAAMLTLFGKMFGMANMGQLHTYIYIGFILILFYICSNLKMNRLSTICSVLIAALSPIVIWVSKSTLTEMYLTLIMAVFLFCITAVDDKFYTAFSAVPIAVFSFFHVSIYTMLPMFAVIYIYMYIISEKKIYIAANTAACAFFILGISMMLFTSPTYTTNNIVKPIVGYLPFINDNNCIIALSVMAMILAAIGFFFVFVKKAREAVQKLIAHKSFAYIVTAVIVLLVIVCGLNIIRNEQFPENFAHLFKTNSLTGMAYLSGIVVLPVLLCALMFKCRKLLEDSASSAMLIAFIYCVLFRAAFLSKDISHYYYYARYWAPFIAVVAVLAGITVTKKGLYAAVSTVAAGVMLPYDIAMFSGSDDTRMEWETIEDVCAFVDSNDAVVIDSTLINTLVLPVKEITEADIFFPADGESLTDRAEKIKDQYEDVFILSTSDYVMINEEVSCIYSDKIYHSEDLQQNRIALIPFPYSFYSDESEVYLFKLSDHIREYEIPFEGFYSEGFDSPEATFAWSNRSDSSISLYIPEGYYRLTFEIPGYIPFANLNREEFCLEISINGHIYASVDLVSNKEISVLVIPSDFRNEQLVIGFRSDLWSPAEYGSSDVRTLGFPLSGIIVRPVSENNVSRELYYSFSDSNMKVSGFGNVESERFAWSNETKTSVNLGLLPAIDYTLNVNLSNIVPVSSFEEKTYSIDVSFNGTNIGVITLDGSPESCQFTAEISADMVENSNIIEFSSELWSPADFGGNDSRSIGFALESVGLVPQQ